MAKKKTLDPLNGALADLKSVQVLRLSVVTTVTGLCATTIWELVRVGKFPAPFYLTARARRWSRVEVEQWLAERPRHQPKAAA